MRCRGTRDDGSATSAPVVELSGARDVVVSNLGRSVSLQADGTVRAWGLGGFGLLDVPPAPERCGSAGWSSSFRLWRAASSSGSVAILTLLGG